MKKIIEVLLWLRNFISPFLLSVFIGFIVFLAMNKSIWGVIIAAILVGVGIAMGIIFAEKVRNKYGSELFNAVPMATTDLKHLHKDKLDE